MLTLVGVLCIQMTAEIKTLTAYLRLVNIYLDNLSQVTG